MDYFKRYNIWAGWAVFAISALVYILSMEPSASLWDCAEFIATSYKLEVGHPPGAPLFMMIARFFTMFATSTATVALMVNLMSSLASAFTILFLFWSITHLAKRIYSPAKEQLTKPQTWTAIGAGAVGALAYAFSDTFWFSAIEGEVYALSSMFTAMVVWMMLKWEEVADEPKANRWLILIAYMMGLSIGIHILNLLTIPALVFIYYFKKYPKVTKWGVVAATAVSGVIIVVINYIFIPYSVKMGAFVDRIMVNSLGATPNVGMAIFYLALFAFAAWAIYYTHKKRKVFANTVVLCATVIMLGYASYASVVIRAVANPPMNSNNPNNPYALLSLLERDQYGSRPLLYGPYYSSPAIAAIEKKIYTLDDNNKYISYQTTSGLEYPKEFMTIFPRMYSSRHKQAYESWANVTGRKIAFRDEMITIPTAGENMRFFLGYQSNFMYWRYFMWNFVGRQNDTQSSGELTNGNWLSGIDFIDQIYLGPQKNLPSEMKDDESRNTYYFLPFILGLIGLIYHLSRDKRNFVVVMWLFVMMGLVLVLYFNSAPNEPRERDYVYAGSFYAFCIWIGLGVMWIKELLDKIAKRESLVTAIGAVAIASCVPIILVAQNWDDHNRSGRYVTRDIGWNYLQSTLPNSIIMNFGDNDTFPLWYNQEVEDVRLDVRIMNLSYLGADWYIDQMRVRSNESDAVPFSMPRNKYAAGNNDHIYVNDRFKGEAVPISQVMGFINSDDPRTMAKYADYSSMDYIPAVNIALPVNKENAIAAGIVKPEDAHLMVDTVYLKMPESLMKPDLMLLDLLANFDWKRPLYFTQIYSLEMGLKDYLQFDGYAYRLVPIKTPAKSAIETGRIDSEYLYGKLMKEFKYGNISDPKVYTGHFVQNNFNSTNARNGFASLSKALTQQGDTLRAIEVLDSAVERIPFSQIKHTYRSTMPLIEAYYMAGAMDKANAILEDYAGILMEYLLYFKQFEGDKAKQVETEMQEKLALLDELYRIANAFRQDAQLDKIEAFYTAQNL